MKASKSKVLSLKTLWLGFTASPSTTPSPATNAVAPLEVSYSVNQQPGVGSAKVKKLPCVQFITLPLYIALLISQCVKHLKCDNQFSQPITELTHKSFMGLTLRPLHSTSLLDNIELIHTSSEEPARIQLLMRV